VTDESPYHAVLRDLLAKREKLDTAIKLIEDLIGAGDLPGDSPVVPKEGQIRSDSFFGMTIADAAKRYLSVSKAPKTITEIADALRAGGYLFATRNPAATVKLTLYRLDRNGIDFVKLPSGQYGLREWYPNVARNKRKVADDAETENGDEEGQQET